jgi:hypothetical protein
LTHRAHQKRCCRCFGSQSFESSSSSRFRRLKAFVKRKKQKRKAPRAFEEETKSPSSFLSRQSGSVFWVSSSSLREKRVEDI